MMKVIIPNPVELLSCSVSETDAADGVTWNASTTYAKDAKVRYNHVRYQSLDGGNKGNRPDQTWSGTEAKWQKLGATGPYLMLDDYVETKTRSQVGKDLTFCVSYNRCDAFALLGLEGYAMQARVYDLDLDPHGAVSIWPSEYDFWEDITDISLWEYIYVPVENSWKLIKDISKLSLYEYNYSPIIGADKFARTGTSMPLNGKLCVEINAENSEITTAVGHIVCGRLHELGWTEYDAELGFTDYSRKNTDEFGRTTLIKRSATNSMSLPIYLHPDQSDYVETVLRSARGLPTLWIGDNTDKGFQAMTIYGWLEDYRMVYAGPNEMQLSLEIQGLI